MLDLDDRLDELKQLGLYRRTRMVSGPQGPRVVLDGRPVLVLCSGNSLGLADHPRVREAAADAAMRWGVGRGGAAGGLRDDDAAPPARGAARRASWARTRRSSSARARSPTSASSRRWPARARWSSTTSWRTPRSSTAAGWPAPRRSPTGTPTRSTSPGASRSADGRGALIATDGVFGLDGDVAPLEDIVALARRHDVRVLVDEAQAIGAVGPGGRGAVAEAGLEDEVDVITGSLGKALGSYGGFACCDHVTARYLVNSARTLLHSTAPPPVAVAAAMAALELLEEEPRRVERLLANAEALRDELAREGFEVAGASTHVVPLLVGETEPAVRIVEHALEQGVFTEAVLPPSVPDGAARLRLAVMASHTRAELRGASRVLARAALRAGVRPGAGGPVALAQVDELPRAAC